MQDVILQGYVFGPRCPGVVKAELASIEQAYLTALAEAVPDGDDGVTPAGTAVFVTAWHTFLRETIQAMVPGLTPGEADVLAAVPPGAEGEGTAILRYLGVWQDRVPGEAEPDPEAGGGEAPSTTAPSSPTSPPSTGSGPPSS